jgi:streptomycin 6-kinase
LAEITVSDMLQRTIAQFGNAGREWFEALPGTITRLEAKWGVRVGRPFEMAGVSYTAEATRSDGEAVVLKVPIPHDEAKREPDALRAWDGHGAILLLEIDDSGAMLLERCDPGVRLSEAAAPDEVSTMGGELLRALHRPVADGRGFELLSDVMARWARLAQERVRTIGSSVDVALIDEGAELLETLPLESDEHVLLHGDYHHWNVLSAMREPWLAIDPKPMVGDPVYDSAQFLGNRFGTRGPDEFEGELVRFAAGAGFDVNRVLRWCFARECENSQWILSVDDPEGARGSLAYARMLKGLLG